MQERIVQEGEPVSNNIKIEITKENVSKKIKIHRWKHHWYFQATLTERDYEILGHVISGSHIIFDLFMVFYASFLVQQFLNEYTMTEFDRNNWHGKIFFLN